MITEEIIKKAQEGDSEAFAIIYNETVKTAYYVAKRILISEEATEDVLQEAYIAVYKHLSDYKSGNFQGWVDTIVANRAKNYLRKENPILFSEMESEERPVVEFEEEKVEFRPEEKVDYNETQRLILEIIDNLSPEQRLSVILFYFESRNVKEIAEICECSENTVKSRLNYARKKIKEDVLELEKKGTKLYSISIMPFIMWMLAEKANAAEVPGGLAAKVLASTGTVAGSVAGSTVGATSVAGTTAGATASATTGAAGATVAVATKAGMALGVKIAIGVTVAAITTGAVITGVAIKNSEDAPKDDVNVTFESEDEEDDSRADDKLESDAEDGEEGVKEDSKKNEKVLKTKQKRYKDICETYEYNEDGKELEYIKINESTGDILEHTECVYDDQGKLTKKIDHVTPSLTVNYLEELYGIGILDKTEIDNVPVFTSQIDDYPDGKWVFVTYEDYDGNVLDRTEFYFYENGKIKQEIYRADKVSKTVVDYDERGGQKYVTYGDDGTINNSGEITCDEYGNYLSETFYDGNGVCYLERSYVYEYDENNKVIKESKTVKDNLSGDNNTIESVYTYTYYE